MSEATRRMLRFFSIVFLFLLAGPPLGTFILSVWIFATPIFDPFFQQTSLLLQAILDLPGRCFSVKVGTPNLQRSVQTFLQLISVGMPFSFLAGGVQATLTGAVAAAADLVWTRASVLIVSLFATTLGIVVSAYLLMTESTLGEGVLCARGVNIVFTIILVHAGAGWTCAHLYQKLFFEDGYTN